MQMIIDEVGNVRMTRGDSAEFSVELKDDEGNPVTVEPGAVAIATVRIQKTDAIVFAVDGTVDGSTIYFSVAPEATQTAKAGKHRYDVELTEVDGTRSTVVGGEKTGPLVWELMEDETRHG